MSVVVPILVSVFGVIGFVIFLVYNSYLNSKEKKVVARPNMPFIEINSEIRKSIVGYSRGVVGLQTPKPNGTILLKIYPDDVEQGEDIKRPDFRELIVHKDYIRRHSEGEAYPKRQLVEILPFDNLDLPERMRGTEKGKKLEEEGQKALTKQLMGMGFKNNRDALLEAFKEYAFGEISEADQKRLKDLSKKERQIQGIEERKDESKN